MKEGPPYEKSSLYLERSGGYPLTIDIDLTEVSQFDMFERDFLSQRLLPQLYRSRSFHMSSKSMESFWIVLPRFTTRPAPYLETFEVLCYADESSIRKGWDGLWPEQDMREIARAFGGGAPNLRSMTISGLHVPWQTFDLAGLQSLAFDFHSPDVRRSLQSFYDILRSSVGLRMLTVMQAGSDLRISPNWLASHTIDIPSNTISHFKPLSLPGLEELVYTFAENGLACDLLELISTPNIHALTLEYIKNDCASLLDLIGSPPGLFPKLTHLRLVGLTSIRPGRMLQFLRGACQNVTTLHVNAVRCPTLKEISFLLRWMAMERREYLIPKLEEISTDGFTPKNLREMIQSRPEELRPKKVVMRKRDWSHSRDESMQWLMDQTDVQFVEGSSDDEGD